MYRMVAIDGTQKGSRCGITVGRAASDQQVDGRRRAGVFVNMDAASDYINQVQSHARITTTSQIGYSTTDLRFVINEP